jgi:hypothetical protein
LRYVNDLSREHVLSLRRNFHNRKYPSIFYPSLKRALKPFVRFVVKEENQLKHRPKIYDEKLYANLDSSYLNTELCIAVTRGGKREAGTTGCGWSGLRCRIRMQCGWVIHGGGVMDAMFIYVPIM